MRHHVHTHGEPWPCIVHGEPWPAAGELPGAPRVPSDWFELYNAGAARGDRAETDFFAHLLVG